MKKLGIFVLIFLFSIQFTLAIEITIHNSNDPTYPSAKLFTYGNAIDPNKVPVLLVHGWGNKNEMGEPGWGDVDKELNKSGYQVYKLRYYPQNLDNRKNAYIVGKSVNTIFNNHDNYTVNIIAHSMGGLAVRGYLEDMAIDPSGNEYLFNDDVYKVVFIGSPMQGSFFANIINDNTDVRLYNHPLCIDLIDDLSLYGKTAATYDMAIGSDFVYEINRKELPNSIEVLTISGSRNMDNIDIPLRNYEYCLGNSIENNDGIVSLQSSSLTKESVPSVLIDKFHLTNGVVDNFNGGDLGIDTSDETKKIIRLFLDNELNYDSTDTIINENKGECYYDPTSARSCMPDEFYHKSPAVINILNSEIGVSNVVLKTNEDIEYPLSLNVHSGKWYYINIDEIKNKKIDFTSLLPNSRYYLYIDGKPADFSFQNAQESFVEANLDKDNDGFDNSFVGGSDCNDDDNSMFPIKDGKNNILRSSSKLCPGTYQLSQSLKISKSDITIDCNGATLKPSQINSGSGFYLSGNQFSTNLNNLIIKNCIFDGFERGIEFGEMTNNIYLINNTFKNNRFGIHIYNAGHVEIKDSIFENNYQNAINIQSGDVLITNNQFINNGVSGDINKPALNIISTNNKIYNNTFIGNGVKDNDIPNNQYCVNGVGNIYSNGANGTSCVICVPNWSCSQWNTCTNQQQTRTCQDLNSCNVTTNKPIENQACTEICSPNWQCSEWSQCSNSQQTRSCNDLQQCGILLGKPIETQSCQMPPICSPEWICSSWSTCSNELQSRICTDVHSCNVLTNKPSESQSCTIQDDDDDSDDDNDLSSNKKKSSKRNILDFGDLEEPQNIVYQPLVEETENYYEVLSLTTKKADEKDIINKEVKSRNTQIVMFALTFSLIGILVLLLLIVKVLGRKR